MHGTWHATQGVDRSLLAGSEANWWQKYRVQVPIALLLAALVQVVLAAWQNPQNYWNINLQSSLLIALTANGLGLVWFRNMRHFPGTKGFAFLLPMFAFSWFFALLVVAALRLPYSALLLSVGAVSAIVISTAFTVWLRLPTAQSFLVIPSMRVNATLAELPQLNHKICETVVELKDNHAPIIADLHSALSKDWEEALVQATLQGRNVYHIKQIKESLTGRVQIDHLSENSLGTLAPDESYAFVRSVAERVLSLILVVLLSPVLIICAAAIKLESPGPALFRQTRIGLGGKSFTIFKLRTMKHVPSVNSLEADITQNNDPRITAFGNFLRKSRIDELPQLINVARGEMSIIGPRPETEKLSNWYAKELDFYAYRHAVLPGITGWAQVRQGHVANPEDVFQKLQYDFYYIKNFSFWLDVVIVFETIKVMALKIGAK